MIVTQEIARIAQALLKDTAASLVEGTWQSLTPLNLTPGQVVQGEVMASLPQSRYLVRVANELLKMELPLNLQPGQAVELTYVTDEPRIIFALSKSANSGAPVQISDAGRWLNGLAQEGNSPSATAPLPRPSLILPSPSSDPATLAEGLKNALSRSGNFYESHLAGWMRGDRPLVDLLKEPQGTLSRLAALLPAETAETPAAAPPAAPSSAASPAASEGEPAPRGQNPSPPAGGASRDAALPAPAATTADASPAKGSEPPPADGMAPAPPPPAAAALPEAGHPDQAAAALRPGATDAPPAGFAPPPAEGAAPAPAAPGAPPAAPAHDAAIHDPSVHGAASHSSPSASPAAPTASPLPPDGAPAPGAALPREVPLLPEREPLPAAKAPEPPPRRHRPPREVSRG